MKAAVLKKEANTLPELLDEYEEECLNAIRLIGWLKLRTLTRKLHLTPAMQAYAHQNLSNAGFGSDNSQSSGMKTCRYAGYITACKGAAGELLLRTCLHELN